MKEKTGERHGIWQEEMSRKEGACTDQHTRIHWHKHCSKIQGDKEAWKGKKEHGGRALRWTVPIVC